MTKMSYAEGCSRNVRVLDSDAENLLALRVCVYIYIQILFVYIYTYI